jgi:predicted TIM-barrel fold metal-dependent hydrolase
VDIRTVGDKDGGLIDVHAHFLTESYLAAATATGHRTPDGMPGWPSWSAEAHLGLMDSAGIDRAVLSISSPGVHFGDDTAARELARETNEFAAAVARAHPGRFGHFAALPLPDVDGAVAETRYALDVLGADGVAILSNAHGHYPGDPVLEPLLAELDPANPGVDSATLLSRCWFDSAGTALPTQLPTLAATVGTGHIVYGSDFCFTPSPVVEAHVAALTATRGPAPHRAWRDLLAVNTRTLLGR